ncbi:MAG TPA: hypothetical protein VHB68_06395 [Steroidobacteraceae bacterium]|nr:hypothetical protein [Steroidobacteraceae bacterium]
MKSANDSGSSKVRALRDLPASIDPPRDLWAGIEARIGAEGRRRDVDRDSAGTHSDFDRARLRWRRGEPLRWLTAAAVIAALAVGIWIGRAVLPALHQPSGGNGMTAHVTPPAMNDEAQAVQAAYVSDPKFRSQREALAKSLEARLAALPPDSRAKVISSLATLHKSMRDLEAALGKDPTNALLQELLLNTYQDEMRVLTTVNEASEAGRGI